MVQREEAIAANNTLSIQKISEVAVPPKPVQEEAVPVMESFKLKNPIKSEEEDEKETPVPNHDIEEK
jgi:hypothetical protein